MTDIIPAHLAHLTFDELQRVQRIAALNDAFRRSGPTDSRGQWVLTAGVCELPALVKVGAIIRTMQFRAFTSDNDPHGEHDFGSFKESGRRFFWKIDCYDEDFEHLSEAPDDAAKTKRVLTLMLASEY